MKRIITALILGLLCALSSISMAATPLGGLTVALAPDEKVMVAAGDNRTLYVIDPVSLEVTRRVWLGVCILELQFNRDGGLLVAEDSDGALHLIETQTWTEKKNLPKAGSLSTSRKADLAAGLDPDYNGQVIRFLSMTDLSEMGQIKFEKGRKVAAMGLDAEGRRLAVLFENVNDDSEPKGAKPPADLKGLAAEEFKLKNDGKTAMFMLFKAPGGEKISEHKLYYSPSYTGARILFQGDDALVVNYSNLNAQINSKGEAALFGLDNSFNYGLGFSPDQNILLSGGLSQGTYTQTQGMNKTSFKPDRLSGWPEYFKGFAVAADGTAYGATSAYRIIKIKPGGVFEKSVPIF